MNDRQRKLIFLLIPKTGGNSIESLLLDSEEVGAHRKLDHDVLTKEPLNPYFPLMRHASLQECEQFLKSNLEDPASYRVFALVRNPQDVLKSLYRFRRKNFELRRAVLGALQRLRFRPEYSSYSFFLLMLMCRHLVGRRGVEPLEHYIQSDSGIDVRVFRLEDISNNADELMSWLDLPQHRRESLPHSNPTSAKQPLRSWFQQSAAKLCFGSMNTYYQPDGSGRDALAERPPS